MIDASSRGAEISQAIREGRVSALEVTEFALRQVEANNDSLNALTHVTAERALEEARAVDAQRDATLQQRLNAGGAVLLGALNMGEYAYDFTGENYHYGPSRNPHDPRYMSGGSSGGRELRWRRGWCR